MEKLPNHTCYNTEVQIMEGKTIIDVRTTDPYSPRENKLKENKIIKLKSKTIRVQSNITKRVQDFVMVWQSEMYSFTEAKYG